MLPADVYARYLAPARPRGPAHLRHRRARHPGRAGRQGGRPRRSPSSARSRTRCRRTSASGFGLSLRPLRPQLLAAEPRAHPALRRAASTTKGYIEERVTKQVYSPADGRFLPDRYIVGTCPHCGYDERPRRPVRELHPGARPHRPDRARARRSPGSTDLEVRETKHLFLLQSKLARRGARRGSRRTPTLAGARPSIARKWLDRGPAGPRHHPRPRLGRAGPTDTCPGWVEGKVFYVWFDAPIEYIGATTEWADASTRTHRDWRAWWYDADDVELHAVHGQGQRAVPHGVVPGHADSARASRGSWSTRSRASTGSPTTAASSPPRQSRGVFMDQALDTLPADYWRWFLFANAPESDDAELHVGALHRARSTRTSPTPSATSSTACLTLSAKHYGAGVPAGGAPGEREQQLAADLGGRRPRLHRAARRRRSCGSRPTSCGAAGRSPTPTGSRASRGRSSRPTRTRRP